MTFPRIKTAALLLSIATLQTATFTMLPLDAAQAQDTANVTVTFTGGSGLDTTMRLHHLLDSTQACTLVRLFFRLLVIKSSS